MKLATPDERDRSRHAMNLALTAYFSRHPKPSLPGQSDEDSRERARRVLTEHGVALEPPGEEAKP